MTLPDSDSPAAAFVLTAVLGLLTFAWNKITGNKTADIRATAQGIVDQAVHLFVTAADQHPEDIRAKVLDYVWRAAAKVGIAKSPAVELVVRPLVEQAIADALFALRERDHYAQLEMDKAIAQLAAANDPKRFEAELARIAAKTVAIQPPDSVVIVTGNTEVMTDTPREREARAVDLVAKASSDLAAGTPGASK